MEGWTKGVSSWLVRGGLAIHRFGESSMCVLGKTIRLALSAASLRCHGNGHRKPKNEHMYPRGLWIGGTLVWVTSISLVLKLLVE